MEQKVKAIFFDLDGTLLSHTDGRIPESTLAALECLRAQGIRLLLATGRDMEQIRYLTGDQLQMDGYVLINGQLCLDAWEQVILDLPIPQQDMDILAEAFASKAYPMMLVQRGRMYGNLVDQVVRRVQADISSPLPKLGSYDGGPVYQCVVYDDGRGLEALMGRLSECQMTRWNPGAVDILGKAGGKVTGIRHFLQRNGWQREEIMAFGDGDNDIKMLQFAGIGVAMGNAQPEVQAQADFVTTHIDRDGVANALRHFALIP